MAADELQTAASLRAELREHRVLNKRGAYPSGLSERARRCAQALRRRGHSLARVQEQLGVAAGTARAWCRAGGPSLPDDEPISFVPLVVDEATTNAGRVEVSLPSGIMLRVDKMDVKTVRTLVEALMEVQP